jgi:hypothetical protein
MPVKPNNIGWQRANLEATQAPGVNDDTSAGYEVGSRWIDTTNSKGYTCFDPSAGAAVWVETTAGATGGEQNTASNVGTGGVGVFKQKLGVDLQFKKLNAGSTKVTITDDTGDDEVDIDVDGGLILDGEISATGGLLHKTAAETYEAIKTNLSASVAPTTTDDTSAGYAVGSRWIDTTADKEYVCLDATTSTAVWIETTASGGGGQKIQSWEFPAYASKPTGYTKIGTLLWRGSTAMGTPTNIKVVGGVDGTGGVDYRVQDLTNSTTICEVTGDGSTCPAIIDLGTLSNVTTGEAIWELQINKSSGGGGVNVCADAAAVYF